LEGKHGGRGVERELGRGGDAVGDFEGFVGEWGESDHGLIQGR
jgi:hypothetical protein